MNVFVFAETKQLACAALRFSFFFVSPFCFQRLFIFFLIYFCLTDIY